MRKLTTLVLASALVAACGGETTGTSDLSRDAGSYTLRSMNGAALPYLAQSAANYTVNLTGETIDMGATGSFRDVVALTTVQNGVTTRSADTTQGTWSERGSTVTFTANTGETITAVVAGSNMTISGRDVVGLPLIAVYQK